MSSRVWKQLGALCLLLVIADSCPCLNAEPGFSSTPVSGSPGKPLEIEVPDDFLDQIAKDGSILRSTLPDGHPVVGKIASAERDAAGLTRIEGGIQHPDPGTFRITRTGSRVEGSLRISGKPTEWKVTASGEHRDHAILIEVAIQAQAATNWSAVPTVIESETATQLIVRDSSPMAAAPRRFLRLRGHPQP